MAALSFVVQIWRYSYRLGKLRVLVFPLNFVLELA